MNFVLRPWQFFFLILSGWVNRRQQEIIDFQNAQIQALMGKLGRKRILLTDDQRRVLAVSCLNDKVNLLPTTEGVRFGALFASCFDSVSGPQLA